MHTILQSLQPSQNQAVIGSLSRLLEMFARLLSKGPIAFSRIQESLSLLLPTNNLLFKIFLRKWSLCTLHVVVLRLESETFDAHFTRKNHKKNSCRQLKKPRVQTLSGVQGVVYAGSRADARGMACIPDPVELVVFDFVHERAHSLLEVARSGDWTGPVLNSHVVNSNVSTVTMASHAFEHHLEVKTCLSVSNMWHENREPLHSYYYWTNAAQ